MCSESSWNVKQNKHGVFVVDSSNELSDFLTDVSSGGRKEKTYFWQYNTQSKGPKGKRLCRVVHDNDPYVLHDFEDPVFDTELLVNCTAFICTWRCMNYICGVISQWRQNTDLNPASELYRYMSSSSLFYDIMPLYICTLALLREYKMLIKYRFYQTKL